MSVANNPHNQAMDLVESAIMERMRGNTERVAQLYAEALELELTAIHELEEQTERPEPTWSVLHRSAGWMAFNSNQFRLAKQLAAKALAGDPHPEIADELDDLLAQANYYERLRRNGIALGENAVQLSLSGQEVGPGIVNSEAVYQRIHSISLMIYRIAERQSGQAFRERGSPPKEIRERYQTLVSVPVAGSFLVTLRLGNPVQPLLPTMSDSMEILDEFMDILELANRARVADLQEKIPEPAYRRNFYGLAREIAPDGKRINRVGLSISKHGGERSVVITLPGSEFEPLPPDELPEVELESVELRGKLLYADATSATEDLIRIVDAVGRSHTVKVPSGMMNDIVRPMWDSMVTISGLRRGATIELQNITPEDAAD